VDYEFSIEIERTFTIKEFMRVLAGERDTLGEFTQQFNYLRNVIVILAVARSRSGIEEVVASGD